MHASNVVVTSPQVDSVKQKINIARKIINSRMALLSETEDLVMHRSQSAQGAEAKFAHFGEGQVPGNKNGVHVFDIDCAIVIGE
jgi:hypothetical protein